jgi:hypothetical protein
MVICEYKSECNYYDSGSITCNERGISSFCGIYKEIRQKGMIIKKPVKSLMGRISTLIVK